MHRFTLRLEKDLYKDLQAVAMAEGRTMVEVIRASVRDYTQRQPGLEEIKDLIAKARSFGAVSEDNALEAAKLVAEVDDSEGIGTLRATKK